MRRISDVMTTDVQTVTSSAVVGEMRDLMLDGGIHGLPVLDRAGAVVGIVTSSDLVEEHAPELGVTAVMSHEVLTAASRDTLVDAARAMLDARVHHLVVVDDEDVVGIVSSFDLLRELAGEVEAQASRALPGRLSAEPGDTILIRGHAVGRKERRGTIVEARGADGGAPFVVRWLDDPHDEPHDVLFFPGSDSDIVHRDDGADDGADAAGD